MASENKCLLFSLLFLGLWVFGAASRVLDTRFMAERHEQWMALHGRVYESDAEKERRFKIFQENVNYIESFNREGGHKYTLGVNAFADMTNEEFKARYTGLRPAGAPSTVKATRAFKYENVTAVPPTVDWRTNGVVTPVKDQGQCGN